jgi:hypothetical protein
MTRRHPVAGGPLRAQDTESESLFVTEQTGHGAERGKLRTRARRITHHSKSADPGEELHKLYWILALGPSSGVWLLETELRMRSYPSAELRKMITSRIKIMSRTSWSGLKNAVGASNGIRRANIRKATRRIQSSSFSYSWNTPGAQDNLKSARNYQAWNDIQRSWSRPRTAERPKSYGSLSICRARHGGLDPHLRLRLGETAKERVQGSTGK